MGYISRNESLGDFDIVWISQSVLDKTKIRYAVIRQYSIEALLCVLLVTKCHVDHGCIYYYDLFAM